MSRPTHCVCCGQRFIFGGKKKPGLAIHVARGLCTRCDSWLRQHGGVEIFPRLTRSYVEVREEWEHLKSGGFSKAAAARVLQMDYQNFLTALKGSEARV